MEAVIAVSAAAYCGFFFLKGVKSRLAALFAVDAVIFAMLFAGGTALPAAAAFIASAAALNAAVFLTPKGEKQAPYGKKDFLFIALNLAIAALAAVFSLINAGAAEPAGAAPEPVMAAFIFMAVSVAGYFLMPRAAEEAK